MDTLSANHGDGLATAIRNPHLLDEPLRQVERRSHFELLQQWITIIWETLVESQFLDALADTVLRLLVPKKYHDALEPIKKPAIWQLAAADDAKPRRVLYWDFLVIPREMHARMPVLACACREGWHAVAALRGSCQPRAASDRIFWVLPHHLVFLDLDHPPYCGRPGGQPTPLNRGFLHARREIAIMRDLFLAGAAASDHYRWLAHAWGLRIVIVILRRPAMAVRMEERREEARPYEVAVEASGCYDDKEELDRLDRLWKAPRL
ncbi:hypothetical protein VTI74DRAFT_6751 [Chaetomium olivicolor]